MGKQKTKLKLNQDLHLELFYKVVNELNKTHPSTWNDICDEANVSIGTLYKWVNWEIWCPHLRTVVNVANALGFDVVLVKQDAVKLRSVK